MATTEDGESEISNGRFWEGLEIIRQTLAEKGFKVVPEDTMPLLKEMIDVSVDMVIPLRDSKNRRNFLKADHRNGGRLKKTSFVNSLVRVEGAEFIFVAMDPKWEPDS